MGCQFKKQDEVPVATEKAKEDYKGNGSEGQGPEARAVRAHEEGKECPQRKISGSKRKTATRSDSK